MCVDGVEPNASRVNTSNNEIGADIALVTEKMLLQHCHACNHAWGTAGREGVKFEVRADKVGGEFGVGGGTRTCTPDLRGYFVEFLAVL